MDEARIDLARVRARAHYERFHLAVRRPANWLELIRYCMVGASGYVVNLAVFWLVEHRLSYPIAFTLAFVAAASGNFVLNRRFTFRSTMASPTTSTPGSSPSAPPRSASTWRCWRSWSR